MDPANESQRKTPKRERDTGENATRVRALMGRQLEEVRARVEHLKHMQRRQRRLEKGHEVECGHHVVRTLVSLVTTKSPL